MASDNITRQLRRAEYLRRYFADTGREYATGKNVKCPNAAAHTHGDANASARIYENESGAFVKCHGCGGTWDIFNFWQMDNCGTFADAKAALCERFAIARTVGGNVAATETAAAHGAAVSTDRAQAASPDGRTVEYINGCAAKFQGEANAGRAYMRGRGISDETARRFKIGFDEREQAVIIPQGAGWLARSTVPNVGQKDKCRHYPKGVARVLFNGAAMERAAADGVPVFIVEGEMDALSIIEVGGVAVSTGGTAGIGKAVKAAAQIGRGVYVPCMDRDEHGEEAQAEIVAKLRAVGGEVYVYEGAPLSLLPDGADGLHPKDANEALQHDAAGFRARVAALIGAAKGYAQAEDAKRKPYITLAEIPEPPDESSNPRALFRGGWLRKGGGVIAASVAGAGKSTFSLQCALHWVLGAGCFGIEPVRPLRVAVIQAEDDIEELAMFRASMIQGLTADGFAADRINEALRGLHIRTDFIGKTGEDFSRALRVMQLRDKYDLVMVNPLNSYFDGDISLNKDATAFFRKLIDPVIKNPETECGIIFIHHMGKPAKGKDAAAWGKGSYAQYTLQGAAELNNWARAVLILIPFDNAPDFWTLTAAKRYKPLGWKDADGKDTKDKIIAYSKDYVYWRVPSVIEIEAAKNGTAARQETEKERKQREDLELRQAIAEIVNWLTRTEPKSKTEVRKWCEKNEGAIFKGFHSHTVKNKVTGEYYPKKPCYLAYELIMENPTRYGVGFQSGKYKNGKEYQLYGGVAAVTDGGAAMVGGVAAVTDAATATDIDGQGAGYSDELYDDDEEGITL